MKSSLKDLPVINENAQRVSRATTWGGMEFTRERFMRPTDIQMRSASAPTGDMS